MMQRNKARRLELKKLGLCQDCGFNEPIPGQAFCGLCHEKREESRAKRRIKLLDEDLCRCGAPLEQPVRYFSCLACRIKDRNRPPRTKRNHTSATTAAQETP